MGAKKKKNTKNKTVIYNSEKYLKPQKRGDDDNGMTKLLRSLRSAVKEEVTSKYWEKEYKKSCDKQNNKR